MTAAPGVAPARVLVVDDTALNRDLLTRRVEKLGHQVRTAENGRQALELVSASRRAPGPCEAGRAEHGRLPGARRDAIHEKVRGEVVTRARELLNAPRKKAA